jgi:adenylosuccinate synthase
MMSDKYEDIIWQDENTKIPTKQECEDELKRLEEEDKKTQYQRDRAVAYDPIPEQLDQIYHDMDGWKAKIKAVKDKYPKPT